MSFGCRGTDSDTQKGSALVMSLIILLLLSLIAISGMQGGIFQERMATAHRDGVMSLEAAETALRDAQDSLDGFFDLVPFGTQAGFHTASGNPPGVFDSANWDDTNSVHFNPVGGVEARYFVEYVGPVPVAGRLPQRASDAPVPLHSARIVVVSQGASGQAQRAIESYYVFSADI